MPALVHRFGSILPLPLRHGAKLLLRPQYRARVGELRRLSRLPRYTPTTTNLLGVPIAIVDAESFLGMYREIFENQIYRFQSRDRAPRIIDGGANIGLATIYFKRHYPNSRIVAFEPDGNVYRALRENCERLGYSDVDLCNAALWTSDGTVDFAAEGSVGGRISTEPGERFEQRVPARRLRDLLGEAVAFLKLDIEGAETDVLLDCRDRLVDVENLFVEYHSFVGRPQRLRDLIDVLHGAGFRLFLHNLFPSREPLVAPPVYMGMDLLLNIFGYRS